MKIDIHDVGHGACIVVASRDGRKVMIDCGHSSDPVWRPSIAYMFDSFETLILSNFDEDHVSDFANLMRRHDRPAQPTGLLSNSEPTFRFIDYNQSVTAADLAFLKPQGLGVGMARVSRHLANVDAGHVGPVSTPDYGAMSVFSYWNPYPFLEESGNTNDISVLTVIEETGFKLVSCGDMTARGLRQLLTDRPVLQEVVANAQVLIAPHHGRENGYDADVLDVISPELVVFSDKAIVHDTQKSAQLFAQHAKGHHVSSGTGFGEMRKVVTTRNDGHIRVETLSLLGGWSVTTGVQTL